MDRSITISEACKLVLDRTNMIVPLGFYEGPPEAERPTYAEAAEDVIAEIDHHRECIQLPADAWLQGRM